ncbi:MAG: helix-turn-helix domain-containing protein [Actinomycetota bacterium]|nr:helix-turn-helix domain-containing protein [Actinomycetota bacterium]
MSVAFRNLKASPEDPVSAWPAEGVRIALERGGLAEWRRLAGEIDADPWGRSARQVEEVLGHSRPYGVAEIFERLIDDARERAESEERVTVAAELHDLVEAAGLTQAEFARRIGTSASRLSSYVTGAVVPSATLIVRARQVAGRQNRASFDALQR